MKKSILLISYLFLGVLGNAQNCDEILKYVYNELHYSSENAFKSDLKKAINMSKDERREKVGKGGFDITFGFGKLLSFGLLNNDENKNMEELKYLFDIDESLVWESEAYTNLLIKLGNPQIIDAWLNCKGRTGIIHKVIGDKSKSFVVNLSYRPRFKNDNREFQIQGVSILGLVSMGEPLNNKVIKSFSGISGIFERTSKKEASIVIDIDGAESIVINLPPVKEKKKVKEIKPEPEPTILEEKVDMPINIIGEFKLTNADTEVDTDPGDIVSTRCTTRIELVENEIILKISYFLRENSGNHTTYDDIVAREIFKIPRGKKLVKIEANGGNIVSFKGNTVGRNHRFNPYNTTGTYWDNLYFRVDGPDRNDHKVIGVRGHLKFIIYLQEN